MDPRGRAFTLMPMPTQPALLPAEVAPAWGASPLRSPRCASLADCRPSCEGPLTTPKAGARLRQQGLPLMPLSRPSRRLG